MSPDCAPSLLQVCYKLSGRDGLDEDYSNRVLARLPKALPLRPYLGEEILDLDGNCWSIRGICHIGRAYGDQLLLTVRRI